jgi:hypothetical protein
MLVIGIFVFFVAMQDAIGAAICVLVERYSEPASLIVFLGIFVVNFVIAWQIAVWVTERFLLSDAAKKANEEHVKWVNSLNVPARR